MHIYGFVYSLLMLVIIFPNRIIAMCGDYYIGGRRFSSLSDLIGYYSHVSCLLKGEKLLFPVAPPEVMGYFFKTKFYLKCLEITCHLKMSSDFMHISNGSLT